MPDGGEGVKRPGCGKRRFGRVRSGRLTVYKPRSGIVPPEITATMRDEFGADSRPLTRSQVMRASSSAEMSAGYFPESISRISSNARRVSA